MESIDPEIVYFSYNKNNDDDTNNVPKAFTKN